MVGHRFSSWLDRHVAKGSNETLTHIWKPLEYSKQQIRLLVIEPASSKQEPLVCSLKIVSLLDDPEFEALSYTWGTEPPDCNITLRNHSWSIKPNLARALHHFRLARERRFMFVDALCINQSDLSERNTYVRFMGTIYTKAQTVQVWLGEAEGEEELAMETCRKMRYDESFSFNVDCAEALIDLFSKPYWTRAWILQELGLGEEVIINCGPHSIDRVDFPSAWNLYTKVSAFYTGWYRSPEYQEMSTQRAKDDDPRSYIATSLVEMIHAIQPALEMVRGMQLRRLSAKYTATLFQLSRQSCLDPRDHIYALLGLCDKEFSQKIVPGYEDSLNKVFQNFTFKWLTSYKDTDILRHANFGVSDIPDLPSWVPDFSLNYMPLYEGYLNDNYIANRTVPDFRLNDNGWLKINSFCLDRISAIQSVAADESDRNVLAFHKAPAEKVRLHARWRRFLKIEEDPDHTAKSYIGGGTLEDAYWSVLRPDQRYDPARNKALTEWYTAASHPSCDQTFSGDIETITRFHDKTDSHFASRCLFRTEKGYIGITNCDIPRYNAPRSGDYVYFLPSVSSSFYLRPEPDLGENMFKMLGSSFIPGTQAWDFGNNVESDANMLTRAASINLGLHEANRVLMGFTLGAMVSGHPQDRLATEWADIWIV